LFISIRTNCSASLTDILLIIVPLPTRPRTLCCRFTEVALHTHQAIERYRKKPTSCGCYTQQKVMPLSSHCYSTSRDGTCGAQPQGPHPQFGLQLCKCLHQSHHHIGKLTNGWVLIFSFGMGRHHCCEVRKRGYTEEATINKTTCSTSPCTQPHRDSLAY
jgi:hypothetical protein